jgi:CspA family cold shock protein
MQAFVTTPVSNNNHDNIHSLATVFIIIRVRILRMNHNVPKISQQTINGEGDAMQCGTVMFFNDISGTGKIMADDGAHINVSHKALRRDGYKVLDEGQRVSFKSVRRKSGLEAMFVEIIDTCFGR